MINKISDNSKKLADKSKDIEKLKGNVAQKKMELGDLAFRLYGEDKITEPDMLKICEDITNYQKEIDQLNNMIIDLQSKVLFCPYCTSPNEAGDRFCSRCGKDITRSEEVKGASCPQCGFRNTREDFFCAKCGTKLAPLGEEVVQERRYCPQCAFGNAHEDVFCAKCGIKL